MDGTAISKTGTALLRVCGVDELQPGAVRRVRHDPAIAVYNLDGTFYATADLCSHDRSSLAEDGYVEGDEIECGWHFARFRITTGEVTAPPAREPLPTYPVRVEDEAVYVVVTADPAD